MDMSLSFNITINRESIDPALFIASYAIPALIAPSPITEIILFVFPSISLATDIPRPAEIDVELCAAPKGS